MAVYLEDHPPVRSQYRAVRRAAVTGAIVVHTAENATDLSLPDSGAEAVARYISRRTDPGSYHSMVDSDSVVQVGHYEWEMFHEATGGNRWSLGLSFACQAHQWPTLPARWVTDALELGAQEAARMARWVHDTTGVVVPARRITPSEYRSARAGFVGHGDLDPGRRYDPGDDFPWGRFLERFAHYSEQEVGMPPPDDETTIAQIQRDLNAAGYTPALDVDGIIGPNTLAGMSWGAALLAELVNETVPDLEAQIERLQSASGGSGSGSGVDPASELGNKLIELLKLADELKST